MKTNFFASLLLAFALAQPLVLAQEAPQPGPEHEHLKKLAGTWVAKMKVGDAESSGITTSKMELGGLWLISNYSGEFFGQKFEGHGIDGYDAVKKKFVSTWVDSMSNSPMPMEGTFNKEKKELTMIGEAAGPDGKMVKHKTVTHIPDYDTQHFTLYTIGSDGEETKILTIDYTRKK